MKKTKHVFLAVLLLTILAIAFRGPLYRHCFSYKSIGVRTNYRATDNKLTEYIEKESADKNTAGIEDIIKLSLSITSNRLNFTTGRNENDPNKLINSKTANCIGYAAFFATTCNYLLKKRNMSSTWTCTARVGQIYFLSTNIHEYFSDPFFKDHDFATIENSKTGEIYAVDPTVSDYLSIDFINYSN